MAYTCSANFVASTPPANRFCIVLDAGHGGIDSGCIGSTPQICERDINLNIAKAVSNQLKTLNIDVVMTRSNEDGLYGLFASGFKKRDMQERAKIINKANPNLVVSIHLNSFTSPTAKGAQVFYKINSDISLQLAQDLQDIFEQQIPGSRQNAMPGDFFILNCSENPGILVECGFLSNPTEEKLLCTTEYQQRLAYTITCGIVYFFGLK